MEQDRYQTSHTLFIIGMASMIISLVLFALTALVTPSLLFGWRYDTPDFIMVWREWLEFGYGYTDATASKLIVLFLFIMAACFAFVAYFSSNRIDNKIYSDILRAEKKSAKVRWISEEAMQLTMKISFMILLIAMGTVLLSWIISTPSVTNNTGIQSEINQQNTIIE